MPTATHPTGASVRIVAPTTTVAATVRRYEMISQRRISTRSGYSSLSRMSRVK